MPSVSGSQRGSPGHQHQYLLGTCYNASSQVPPQTCQIKTSVAAAVCFNKPVCSHALASLSTTVYAKLWRFFL